MRLAYFDCFSGISGDMALAALIDAGADMATIGSAIGELPVEPFEVELEKVEVRGIAATQVHIASGHQEVIRTYSSIRAMLAQADLPDQVRRNAQRIYQRLAHAMAKVQNKDPELVTFQELGEIDCLVEFVGCAMALDMLGVERIYASPIPTGLGMTRTEHGIMPIPSPMVLELLHGVPTYSRGIPAELVSPAGAAILAALSEGYGDMPMMRADHIGYGAGHLRLDIPNALRVVIGEEQRTGPHPPLPVTLSALAESVRVETTLPEADPGAHRRLMEELVDAGATDAWLTPSFGPLGKAQLTLTAFAPAEQREEIVQLLRFHGSAGDVHVAPALGGPPTIPPGDRSTS